MRLIYERSKQASESNHPQCYSLWRGRDTWLATAKDKREHPCWCIRTPTEWQAIPHMDLIRGR
ncbi:unnamed protein product [Ectocarpus sp. CCAP 1310/34]|nr:unnamed protein product [Ectocarpus sp. CCAP 1310/34]